ncbi:MAG TPA: alkyl sulfatase dimerization domain-containing protein [Rhizomicrobium sp.]|jgi:glyoxylase-like metal-dependent hydrolase (beta-lactamase superfamily II)|nr:alkyl sulfatase dimerization domain-containing protein [Rhizomicrobium sp.]
MAQNPAAKFGELRGKTPEEAKFFWSGGPVQVAERSWFQSQFSGVTAFETDDGLVLVDTGTKQFAPMLAAMLRQKTNAPVHTAIYTHGHVDHAYGLDAFLIAGQKKPRVIAHSAMPARFERYAATARHNAALNARQFGGTVEAQSGESYAAFGQPPIAPDTLYDDRLDINVGDVDFELHHCRGETDDHTWIWCPQRRVLCPGDLFIWAVPNDGNPQKVQRYPWDRAKGLREMAKLGADALCPGHGGPIIGEAEKIARMLNETADFLEVIVKRTLQAMEAGSPPHVDIVTGIELPKSDSPWLQPVYDDTEFIVRNVIRFYGGWWNGRPSDLKPSPRVGLANEIASLCGGAHKLAARALALSGAGDHRLACHLADYALEAAPGDGDVQRDVAAVYDARAAQEESLMAINIFNSAAAYARAGRAFA